MYLPLLPEPEFFFFSSSEFIPKLLYYTHLPSMVISLMMGLYVYLKAQKSIITKTFLLICFSFSSWVVIDLVSWTNPYSDVQMFAWKFFSIILFATVYFSIYFFLVITEKDKLNLKKLWFISLLFIPLFIYTINEKGTDFVMIPFAGVNETKEYLIFSYAIDLLLIIYLVFLSIKKFLVAKGEERSIIVILSAGLFSLLFPFVVLSAYDTYRANIGETITFEFEAHGLWGMNVFMACIAYLIVKYQFFGIKWKANRVLLVALLVIVVSQVFFIGNNHDRIFVAITSVAAVVIGYLLIRVIKSEEETKIKELEKVNVELQKLDKTKSEFINIASHQLRTPLTIVKGVASLLVSGKIDKFSEEDKKQFYGSVWSKCLKLEHIIDDILNAATFTNKKYSVMNQCAEQVDVEQMIEKIVEDFSQEIQEKQLEVSLKYSPTTIPKVLAQKEYLEEAFTNLISNAIKYTPALKTSEKGEQKYIEKGAIDISFDFDQQEKKTVKIYISDNGIGIPADELPKLFQRFYRAENARLMYTDGTGLGLFIVKEIIEGHGGKVEVRSDTQEGTTFIVELPVLPETQPDIRSHIIKQTISSNNIK